LDKTENALPLDTGKPLIVLLLAFIRMRVQAKKPGRIAVGAGGVKPPENT
jgi:hypothetical protein